MSAFLVFFMLSSVLKTQGYVAPLKIYMFSPTVQWNYVYLLGGTMRQIRHGSASITAVVRKTIQCPRGVLLTASIIS